MCVIRVRERRHAINHSRELYKTRTCTLYIYLCGERVNFRFQSVLERVQPVGGHFQRLSVTHSEGVEHVRSQRLDGVLVSGHPFEMFVVLKRSRVKCRTRRWRRRRQCYVSNIVYNYTVTHSGGLVKK